MRTSMRPYAEMVRVTREDMLAWSRTSQGMAVAVPPHSRISRQTVEMVEAGELGSGGKGWVAVASLVDLADTITSVLLLVTGHGMGWDGMG